MGQSAHRFGRVGAVALNSMTRSKLHGNTTQNQNQFNVTRNFQASTFDRSQAKQGLQGRRIKEDRCVACILNAIAKRARFQESLGVRETRVVGK